MPFSLTYSFDTLEELKAHLGAADAPAVAAKPKKTAVTSAEKPEVEKVPGNTSKIPFKAKVEEKKPEADTSGEYEKVKEATFQIVKLPGGREKVINLFSQFPHKDDAKKKAGKGPELRAEDYGAFLAGAEVILGVGSEPEAETEDELA